jgi:hypothetical protein
MLVSHCDPNDRKTGLVAIVDVDSKAEQQLHHFIEPSPAWLCQQSAIAVELVGKMAVSL